MRPSKELFVCALLGLLGILAVAEENLAISDVSQVRLLQAYSTLPLRFEANQGQSVPAVRFLSRGKGYNLFLTPDGVLISLNGPTASVSRKRTTAALRLELGGANPNPKISGVDKLQSKSNYFIGNDPKKWHVDVPTYAKVRYESVYPSVDVVYYGSDGQLETDFVIAPGADPSVVKLRFKGATKTQIDSHGDVLVNLGDTNLRLRKPVTYQYTHGTRHEVASRYKLKGRSRVGFQVEAYDHTQPLIIDPVLVYSTYLGGSGNDQGYGIAVDSAGNAYVAGAAQSSNFPTTTGSFQTTFGGGGEDVFVAKLNSTGSGLVYSTYLGGSGGFGNDEGHDVAVDPAGNAYVTGSTNSTNFPTTPGAFQPTVPFKVCSAVGCTTAFVTQINPTGSGLVYSTYLGGSGEDTGSHIAVDTAGNAYVAGGAQSSDFPTTPGAFQPTPGGVSGSSSGVSDVFVSKLNATASGLIYSTYLGGSGGEGPGRVAIDAAGNAYVAGGTSSTNFPTTPGAFQTTFGGGGLDAFVTELNSAGSGLVYSTYLGGTGGESGSIAIDATGNAYVTGGTSSTNFPTTPGAFQTTYGGGAGDAFLAKLNPTGSQLVYSTYLGGSDQDAGSAVGVDAAGNAYTTGYTKSTNFPTVNAVQAGIGGVDFDAFVTIVNPLGSSLVFSTYLGGSGSDLGLGLALDSNPSAYVTGFTSSTNFPTTPGAFQTTFGGTYDSFVAKIGSPSTVYAAAVQQPINADGSSVFNAKRGVIPVKFTLTADGVSTCDLPTATLSLFRTAGSVIGAIDESVYEMSADTGSSFRISDCQYIYNLSAKPLGPGTYRTDISIGSAVVGSGVFALK